MKLATQAVHVGQHPDPSTGATIPPVYFTSTYTQEAPGKHKGYDYSRSINPTRENLEACIAALESGATLFVTNDRRLTKVREIEFLLFDDYTH